MLKKQCAIGVVALLIYCCSVPPTFAGLGDPQNVQNLLRIKKTISSTSKKTQVTVTLLDKTVVKGRVSQVTDNGFALVDKKDSKIRDISYGEIKTVSRQMSKKKLLGIIGGAAGFAAYYVIKYHVAVG